MRQHDFPVGVLTSQVRCIYCGGLWRAEMTAQCIDRPDPAPEPRRRVSAMEDVDTISARIEELRREHQEALNAPAPGP